MMNCTKTTKKRGKYLLTLLAFAFITILFALPEKANAQKFKKLENGVYDSVVATCTNGNDYYVAYIESPRNTAMIGPDTLRVAKWDGKVWTKFPRVLIFNINLDYGYKSIKSMQFYNGEIIVPCIISYIDSAQKYSYKTYLHRFNGQNWDTLQVLEGQVKDMAIFNNKLYFATNFATNDGTQTTSRVISWDGKIFLQVGQSKNTDPQFQWSTKIYKLLATQDYLYAAGYFTDMDSLKVNNITRWNGSNWDTIQGDHAHKFKLIYSMEFFENNLYLNGDIIYPITNGYYSEIKYLENNTWKNAYKNTEPYSFIESMKTFNGNLYISERIHYYAGKYVFPFNYIRKWDGKIWNSDSVKIETKSGLTNSYRVYDHNTRLDATKNALYLSGKFKTIASDTLNYVAGIFLDSTTTAISSLNKDVNSYLKIYPNPASSDFKIENKSSEIQNLQLINMMGQQVKLIRINAFETIGIDASHLSEGLYIIKPDLLENNKALKVMIRH